ncbi:MAG: hypothetical protein IJA52_07080 [Clostridia bacterium]|nr:hypothetical protein [Clostridia bacterium]
MMKKINHRLVSLVLLIVLLFSSVSCQSSSFDLLNDGANKFGSGKEEDNYSLKNSGALLEMLIDDFSGSYFIPSSSEMDDDDYDSFTNPDDEDPDTGNTGDTGDTGDSTADLSEVGSWKDFKRVMYDAYSKASGYVEFTLVDGYTLDLSDALQESFNELQRYDPIYVGSVKQWTHGSRGSDYKISIDYTMDVTELRRIRDETEELVDQAVAKIDADNKSDYEIVYAVNEYLCDTVYYPDSEPYAPITHTAYGALKNGEAVCEGYACAAKLILNKIGIECDIQVGFCTNGGGHAWNLVELEGQWYQMDVTWNDSSAKRTDYLLVTDDYMKKSRTWDESDYPKCAPKAYTP